MKPISLKRLVSQPEVLSILDKLSGSRETLISIQTLDGKVLVGTETKVETRERGSLADVSLPSFHQVSLPNNRYAVQVADEIIGWVVGHPESQVIANLLTYLANQEQEKKRLAQEVLDKYREVSIISQLSEQLAACFEVKEIASLVLVQAQKVVNSTSSSILLLNEHQILEVVAATGIESQINWSALPGQGIAGNVFVNGQGEVINQVQEDPRFEEQNFPISSLICVPLKGKNKILGIINISSADTIYYTAGDLKLITQLAGLASAAIENAILHEEKLREDRIKSQLERYIPQQLVSAIINSQGDVSFAPRRRQMVILFTDIRGFTTKCEELPAERIVAYLNEYFTQMVDVIFAQDGTINKFVGDMIVAMFGAPYALPDNEKRAIQAAIDMQLRLKNFPNLWIRENFLTGIGISSGDVVVGNIGTPRHTDYTAIGDRVNLASRLQSIAQGGQILVSSSVYEATKEDFAYREVGPITVKGKTKSENVYEVIY